MLEEGDVGAADPVGVVERPFPELTVAHAFGVYSRREGGAAAAEQLAACRLLMPTWRNALSKRS